MTSSDAVIYEDKRLCARLMKRVLILSGGWEGHSPLQTGNWCETAMQSRGFEVHHVHTLERLSDEDWLKSFDLIIPNWTAGELGSAQERALNNAVASGVGLGGWHGMVAAFRNSRLYQFMTGGQFVAHPGNVTKYKVRIAELNDPIVAGLRDFEVMTEQYYLHVDPSNTVLAWTVFHSDEMPWVDGCVMPVVWKRYWSKGRIFYSSLGHEPELFRVPEICEIQLRGLVWATR